MDAPHTSTDDVTTPDQPLAASGARRWAPAALLVALFALIGATTLASGGDEGGDANDAPALARVEPGDGAVDLSVGLWVPGASRDSDSVEVRLQVINRGDATTTLEPSQLRIIDDDGDAVVASFIAGSDLTSELLLGPGETFETWIRAEGNPDELTLAFEHPGQNPIRLPL